MTLSTIRRSSTDRIIFGVAGGLAHSFKLDPVLVRIAFVTLSLFTGLGVVIYLVLAVIMPKEGSAPAGASDVVTQNLRGIPREAAGAGRWLAQVLRNDPPSPSHNGTHQNSRVGAEAEHPRSQSRQS
jgi:phage shock protein C